MNAPTYRLTQINILPEEYRRKAFSTVQLVLAVAVVIEILGLYVVQQQRTSIQNDIKALERQQTSISRNTSQLEPLVIEAEALRTEASALESAVAQLRSGEVQIQDRRIAWPELLKPLLLDLPDGLSLTSIEKVGDTFLIAGASQENAEALNRYHAQLVASPVIKEVAIQTMKTVTREGQPPAVVFTLSVKVAPLELPIPVIP